MNHDIDLYINNLDGVRFAAHMLRAQCSLYCHIYVYIYNTKLATGTATADVRQTMPFSSESTVPGP